VNAPRRIGVLGVGNVLMGDDSVGPFILKILEFRYEFPPDIVLHDLGTPSLGITSFFSDYKAIILFEAVSAKGQPDSVKLYRKDQLVHVAIPQRVSPHDAGLVEALFFAELSGRCPRQVLLVGIVPETVGLGCTLSGSVQSAVASAVAAVLAEFHCLGVAATPRPEDTQPSIWWPENVSCGCPIGETPNVPSYSG
jgi:hydrogenase maturation protease